MQYYNGEKGVALIIVLLLMVIMTLIGLGILNINTIQMRGVASIKKAVTSSLTAESGIEGVVSWMLYHRDVHVPMEIRARANLYETDLVILDSYTTLHITGYSEVWQGALTRISSHSPNKINAVSSTESILFIPIAPAGYGNESR
ncbi:MAG: pilus assembly PilX N-terminal domain-containing protein [Thermodesulfobacteriota bacterium]|nr:pilus assembly PilX N-terminal domain-containing protein [Thermodesulfobacteriota bacterium]